jgi:cytoskeletal protein CcmA (bactofilin family)
MMIVETESIVSGKLKTAGKMRVECWLEGDIVCSRLEIGADGYVLGNVTARELFIEGQIVGRVEASVVHLMEGAFVEGDIKHAVISIHPSATLLGKALHTRGFAPSEVHALESRAANDRNQLEGDCRANARLSDTDWSRYQSAQAS